MRGIEQNISLKYLFYEWGGVDLNSRKASDSLILTADLMF
jgi:hypothetical protein